ncbi:hypothetical protein NDU88_003687 [Pleurodeles waltl]|uniref:Uncharacterized protein n=1 Tax=Pleurodeles waltl TaxID=8319 RepID=A0AAV7VGR2_PLEWA|nr:hypothetical protein NDU88_003687 [Pleurodeles waltl]
MHGIPSMHQPNPFPGFLQGFPSRGSPGPVATVLQRLQRKAQRLPQCTPLAASPHVPVPDTRLRFRSSAVSAGAHAVPASAVSNTVPASNKPKERTRHNASAPQLPKVSAPAVPASHSTFLHAPRPGELAVQALNCPPGSPPPEQSVVP